MGIRNTLLQGNGLPRLLTEPRNDTLRRFNALFSLSEVLDYLAKLADRGNVLDVLLRDRDAELVLEGNELGYLVMTLDGAELARVPLIAAESVERLTLWDLVLMILTAFGR